MINLVFTALAPGPSPSSACATQPHVTDDFLPQTHRGSCGHRFSESSARSRSGANIRKRFENNGKSSRDATIVDKFRFPAPLCRLERHPQPFSKVRNPILPTRTTDLVTSIETAPPAKPHINDAFVRGTGSRTACGPEAVQGCYQITPDLLIHGHKPTTPT
jgi:hypothetical protein